MKVVIVNLLASAFQVHIHQNRATDRSNFVSRKRCNPTKVTSPSFSLALFLSLSFFLMITQLRYLMYSTTCTCRQFVTDRVTLEKGVAAFEEKHSVERLVMKFLEITELGRKTMKVLRTEIVSVQIQSVKLIFQECKRYICVTFELIPEWQISQFFFRDSENSSLKWLVLTDAKPIE